MIVTCKTCRSTYDDAYRWTFCPHDTFAANDGKNNFAHHPESHLKGPMQNNEPVSAEVGRAPVIPVPDYRDPILQYFTYAHLPEHLQTVSKPFCDLAEVVFSTLPRNPERLTTLRKLLEAKDAAVRAAITK